jgi:glycosyltransferase involved in cell wall biosynthesis
VNDAAPHRPTVSVVIATYNRSDVLAFAVESVLAQGYADWELWVIGDACTDETEALMQGYCARDPRIHFHNRPQNFGEQSAPNNDGVARARGDYIAFLNHDDLWLDDHLETALAALRDTDADLVFTLTLAVDPDHSTRIIGATPGGRYDPALFVPASSWLVRRPALERIGPWRPAATLYNIPSQDWLCRAWGAGLTLRAVPRLTVVAVPSGKRKDSYRSRDTEQHRDYRERATDRDVFRATELTRVVVAHPEQALKRYRAITLLKWSLINLFRGLSVRLGQSPEAVKNLLLYGRRGGLIRRMRRTRGLDGRIGAAVAKQSTTVHK